MVIEEITCWVRGSQNGVRFEGPLLKKKRRQSYSLGNVGQRDVEHKTALRIVVPASHQTTETAIPDRKYNHKLQRIIPQATEPLIMLHTFELTVLET